MSDTLNMKARSFNLYRAMLFGYDPEFVQKLIYTRSDHVHRENQLTSRYGNVSHSSTLADGANGVRFIWNTYGHEARWDTVLIPVDAEQEVRMVFKMCDDAGVTYDELMLWIASKPKKGAILQGKNHVKYDKKGAGLSYITKYKIIKPSKTKRVCNRECDDVLLTEFPRMMDIKIPITSFTGEKAAITRKADHTGMTPSQSHGMLVHYFEKGK